MQKSRRDFVKKAAVVTAVGATVASTGMMAKAHEEDDNGLLKGSSNKKEILYKKTPTWEEYYKQAK